MEREGCDLQGAADRVGERFAGLMASFEANKSELPSWGPDLDVAARAFVKGLEMWVIGNCQWSLATQRYFGPQLDVVKRTRVVKLDRKREADEVERTLILQSQQAYTGLAAEEEGVINA